MPIYEYVCVNCGLVFEILRPMKEADKSTPCQKCNNPNTQRKVTTCFSRGSSSSDSVSGSGCGGCAGGNCSSCRH